MKPIFEEEKIYSSIDTSIKSKISEYVEDKDLYEIITRIKDLTQLSGKVMYYMQFDVLQKMHSDNEMVLPHTSLYELLRHINRPNHIKDFVLDPIFVTNAMHTDRGLRYKNMTFHKIYDACVIEYNPDSHAIVVKYMNSQSKNQYEELLKDAKKCKLFICYNIIELQTFNIFYVDMRDEKDWNKYIVDEIKEMIYASFAQSTIIKYSKFNINTIDIVANNIAIAVEDDNKFRSENDIDINIRTYSNLTNGSLDNITFNIDPKTEIYNAKRIVGYDIITKDGLVVDTFTSYKDLRCNLADGYDDDYINVIEASKYNANLSNAFKDEDIIAVITYCKYYQYYQHDTASIPIPDKKLNVIVNFNDKYINKKSEKGFGSN